MENYTENSQPHVERVSEKRGNSAMSAVAAAVGGVAAGVGAMVATVNNGIRSNFMKPFTKSQASLDKYGEKLRSDDMMITEEASMQALRKETELRLHNAMVARTEDVGLRESLTNPKSVLGKAVRTARKKIPHDRKVDQMIEATLPHQLESGDVGLRRDVANLIIDDERAIEKKMIANTAGEIPLMDRLKLSSELHLTRGQKTAAGVAFAATTAIAAGAIYYGVKHFTAGKGDDAPIVMQ